MIAAIDTFGSENIKKREEKINHYDVHLYSTSCLLHFVEIFLNSFYLNKMIPLQVGYIIFVKFYSDRKFNNILQQILQQEKKKEMNYYYWIL